MDLSEYLVKGYFVEEKIDSALIKKEFQESKYDLERAGAAFKSGDYKWCIIQGYYAMFHAIKAVCFSYGYREKKHIGLMVLLEELVADGKLEEQFLLYFRAALDSRESADYHYSHSKETAEHNLKLAKLFVERMRKIEV